MFHNRFVKNIYWLFLTPEASGVSCGGHRAPTCERCPWGPQGYVGRNWCNGECQWGAKDGKCRPKGKVGRTTRFTFVFAGRVKSCGNFFFGPNHVKFDGHCYLFVSKPKTWKEAENQCQRLGVICSRRLKHLDKTYLGELGLGPLSL